MRFLQHQSLSLKTFFEKAEKLQESFHSKKIENFKKTKKLFINISNWSFFCVLVFYFSLFWFFKNQKLQNFQNYFAETPPTMILACRIERKVRFWWILNITFVQNYIFQFRDQDLGQQLLGWVRSFEWEFNNLHSFQPFSDKTNMPKLPMLSTDLGFQTSNYPKLALLLFASKFNQHDKLYSREKNHVDTSVRILMLQKLQKNCNFWNILLVKFMFLNNISFHFFHQSVNQKLLTCGGLL